MLKTEDDMDHPVTRRELREELARYATRDELREELARALTDYPKRQDLEAWAGALNAKIDALSGELAQHANRILESTREMVGVIDEKYNDLPRRVTALEAKVFPPKRQRRR